MTTEFAKFEQTVLPEFIPSLLQAVKNIECVGKFQWRKDNGYAFVSVSNQFGFQSLLPGLYAKGFRVRWTIKKRRYPAAHTSVMVPEEYGSLDESVLIAMEEEQINFRINGVKCMRHVEKDTRGVVLADCLHCQDRRADQGQGKDRLEEEGQLQQPFDCSRV